MAIYDNAVLFAIDQLPSPPQPGDVITDFATKQNWTYNGLEWISGLYDPCLINTGNTCGLLTKITIEVQALIEGVLTTIDTQEYGPCTDNIPYTFNRPTKEDADQYFVTVSLYRGFNTGPSQQYTLTVDVELPDVQSDQFIDKLALVGTRSFEDKVVAVFEHDIEKCQWPPVGKDCDVWTGDCDEWSNSADDPCGIEPCELWPERGTSECENWYGECQPWNDLKGIKYCSNQLSPIVLTRQIIEQEPEVECGSSTIDIPMNELLRAVGTCEKLVKPCNAWDVGSSQDCPTWATEDEPQQGPCDNIFDENLTELQTNHLLYVSDIGFSGDVQQIADVFVNKAETIGVDGVLVGGNNVLSSDVNVVADGWRPFRLFKDQTKLFPALGIYDRQTMSVEPMSTDIVLPYGVGVWDVLITDEQQLPEQPCQIPEQDPVYTGTTPIIKGGNIPSTYDDECGTHDVTAAWMSLRNNYRISDWDHSNYIRFTFDAPGSVTLCLNNEIVYQGNQQLCESWSTMQQIYVPVSQAFNQDGDMDLTLYVAQIEQVDVEIAIVELSPQDAEIINQWGTPQLSVFDYLPTPRSYYKHNFQEIDLELYVLDSGLLYCSPPDSEQPCNVYDHQQRCQLGSEQHNWFLQQVAQSTARWKVVMFNEPYVSSRAPSCCLTPCMDWGFGGLGINLVLNGCVGGNEHIRQDGVNIVNASAQINNLVDWSEPTTIETLVWRDISDNNKSRPAYIIIEVFNNEIELVWRTIDNDQILYSFTVA